MHPLAKVPFFKFNTAKQKVLKKAIQRFGQFLLIFFVTLFKFFVNFFFFHKVIDSNRFYLLLLNKYSLNQVVFTKKATEFQTLLFLKLGYPINKL